MKAFKFKDVRNVLTGVVIGVALTTTTAVSFAGTDSIQALFNRDVKFVVDGKQVKSSSPALMANNSTYLQLRDVADMLDYNVGYKNKTITLTEKGSKSVTESNSTASNAASTTPSATASNNDLTTNKYDYRALPITLDRGDGDISMTLKSITKEDDKIKFNFSISNPTGRKFQIMGETSMSNEGLADKKLFGAPSTGVFYDETQKDWTISYDKELFDSSTKTVRINLKVNYYSLDLYSFKVDTVGMF